MTPYTLSSPPPEGARCAECGSEFDATRKRAPRGAGGVRPARTIVPVEPVNNALPPPEPSYAERLVDAIKGHLAADKVTQRMIKNGPAMRGLLVQPLVIPWAEGKLIKRGIDPANVIVRLGDRAKPVERFATDLWGDSVANLLAAILPGDPSGMQHPMVSQGMMALIGMWAIVQAGRNGGAYTLDMTATLDPTAK